MKAMINTRLQCIVFSVWVLSFIAISTVFVSTQIPPLRYICDTRTESSVII